MASGALVELFCETDFVARTGEFVELANRLAGIVSTDARMASVDALMEAELDGKQVSEVLQEMIVKTGENIVIGRVARLGV